MSSPHPPPPWNEWRPGERIVVRYRAEDGLHDALGYLVEVGADGVVVRTRRGDVPVAAGTMLTGKRVPPPPARRGPSSRRQSPPPEESPEDPSPDERSEGGAPQTTWFHGE
ncbi:hypothetical protein GCM10023169_15060 [Georgenia halophila]|uniref:Ferrous iron transport protein A n=1 Tax=Georgenia halophila TaxID=620889 RepID=A0ABP8L3X1_9MICO